MDDARLRDEVHHSHLQIAIDGPAGAGKSTVGRGVAERLISPYLDTGLMYRAVTWLANHRGVSPGDGPGLARLAGYIDFDLASDGASMLVDGEAMGAELRSPAVDALVSEVSAHPDVRWRLVEKQQAFADDRAVVLVGRDIGTIVLPDAPVKLWVTASPEERARRRLRESLAGIEGATLSDIAERIRARDALDTSRAISPLARANDAVVIDTNQLDEAGAIQAAMDAIALVAERLEHHHSDATQKTSEGKS
jgi:cytidylate kinase